MDQEQDEIVICWRPDCVFCLNLLLHSDLLPAWYAFRDTRASRRAVQWLADNSLIDDDSADTFLLRHPDAALP